MKKIFLRVATVVLLFASMVIFALGLSNQGKSNTVAAVVNTGVKTVIVDAGHGGVDGGAVGVNGEVEKDINLAIAQKLQSLLKDAGYTVIMTRETDVSIHDEDANTIRKQKRSDLNNRLKIINEHPQAIFVSIHQNTINQSYVHGGQMFYSPNNACSKLLAQSIQDSFRENVQTDNTKTIKEAGKNLFILYNATIPSVLCECGFLSNSEEARNLSQEDYQQEIAKAIFKGIEKYLGR